MPHRRYLPGFVTALLITIAGCSEPSEPPLTPSTQVEIHAAESRTFQATLTAYGTAEPTASAAMILAVQFEARIVNVRVTSGESVQKGQPIVELAASAASQLELDRAKRDAVAAQVERARVMRLRNAGLATESELQAADAAAATAAELRDSLVARMGADGVRMLTSPRDGIVDTFTAQPGDLLPSGTVITRIIRADDLMLRLGIEPQDLARLAIHQTVHIEPLSDTTHSISAHVASIDHRVDAQSHLAAAMINLPRDSALLPGAAVRARIVLATHDHAVGISRSAVLYADGHPYAFVADKNIARRRAIRVGIQDGEYIEVEDGIKPGDQIIVSGNYELQDGMAIRTLLGTQP